MNLALNMLTYNGAEFIEKALLSVLPYVQEAYIIDTGSTDSTIKIIRSLIGKFPYLSYAVTDVQSMGETWTGSPKDAALTMFLNDMKEWTKAEWILKVDDDEYFPKELMEEIINLKPEAPIYAIPFINRFGKGDYKKSKDFIIKRLFQNIPEVSWEGIYGKETLAFKKNRISSKKCPRLNNYFVHLGPMRQKIDRLHVY